MAAIQATQRLAFALNTASDYGKALDMALKSLKIAEKLKNHREENMAASYDVMGVINRRMNNDSTAMDQEHLALQLYSESHIAREKIYYGPYITLAINLYKMEELGLCLLTMQKRPMMFLCTILYGRGRSNLYLPRSWPMYMKKRAKFNLPMNTTCAGLKLTKNITPRY